MSAVWTPERLNELRSIWGRFGKREVAKLMNMSIGQVAGKARVLNLHFDRPGAVAPLASDHPAVVSGVSLFHSQVVAASDTYRVLKPGSDTTKLGARVEKGAWRGMPIFSLTLEERATCPRTCRQWDGCYGNSMPFAKRIAPGEELEAALQDELRDLQINNYRGFVVRLHVLGDFYSVSYVERWAQWLTRFPALRVFGYTAHDPQSEIGAAVARLRSDRFAIRFSGSETIVVKRRGEEGAAILCPAQTGKTRSCGTCGLCWAGDFSKPVAFIEHGMKARGKAVSA